MATLGLAAAAALTAFVWTIATRKGEVEQLVDILCGDDLPDAVWAFEKLKEVEDGDLLAIARLLEDRRATSLRVLHYSGDGMMGYTGWRKSQFVVGQVVRFVLSFRTRSLTSIEVWEDSMLHPNMAAYEATALRARDTHLGEDGAQLDPMPSNSNWLNPPAVRPPSRTPSLAALLRDGDVEGLFALLLAPDPAVAAWAFAVLWRLPDEKLDRLLPFLDRTEKTLVFHLSFNDASTAGVSFTAGVVAAAVLVERLKSRDLEQLVLATVHSTVASSTFADLALQTESAWKAHRSAILAR